MEGGSAASSGPPLLPPAVVAVSAPVGGKALDRVLASLPPWPESGAGPVSTQGAAACALVDGVLRSSLLTLLSGASLDEVFRDAKVAVAGEVPPEKASSDSTGQGLEHAEPLEEHDGSSLHLPRDLSHPPFREDAGSNGEANRETASASMSFCLDQEDGNELSMNISKTMGYPALPAALAGSLPLHAATAAAAVGREDSARARSKQQAQPPPGHGKAVNKTRIQQAMEEGQSELHSTLSKAEEKLEALNAKFRRVSERVKRTASTAEDGDEFTF